MEKNCFFEMVKKWTVSDYKTPGMKAEVILDMLISEFVADLVSFHFFEEINEKAVVLLAKELPIQINDSNLNAKVDYLVCVDKTKLVLVELKTTNDSYSKSQKDRMKAAANKGAAELLKFYKRIIGLDNLKKLAKTKYKYSEEMFKEKMQDKNLDENAFSEVDYMYILLAKNDDVKDEKLILDEYCKGGGLYEGFKNKLPEARRVLWEQVSEILKGCADCFDKNEGKYGKENTAKQIRN